MLIWIKAPDDFTYSLGAHDGAKRPQVGINLLTHSGDDADRIKELGFKRSVWANSPSNSNRNKPML